MWRRQHSADIVAEVTPVSGMGTWQVCAWRVAGDVHRNLPDRHFSLLTDAHEAADQLAAVTFEHRCDDICGEWTAVERRKVPRDV
jgi:hypothetical protein